MLITEIKTNWWKLVSTGETDADGLIFFGYSRAEVIGKLNSWLRLRTVEQLR
jgi:hypothetical protein